MFILIVQQQIQFTITRYPIEPTVFPVCLVFHGNPDVPNNFMVHTSPPQFTSSSSSSSLLFFTISMNFSSSINNGEIWKKGEEKFEILFNDVTHGESGGYYVCYRDRRNDRFVRELSDFLDKFIKVEVQPVNVGEIWEKDEDGVMYRIAEKDDCDSSGKDKDYVYYRMVNGDMAYSRQRRMDFLLLFTKFKQPTGTS